VSNKGRYTAFSFSKFLTGIFFITKAVRHQPPDRPSPNSSSLLASYMPTFSKKENKKFPSVRGHFEITRKYGKKELMQTYKVHSKLE
jgi:hypothetical protein